MPSGHPVSPPSRRALERLLHSGASRAELETHYGVQWVTILRWRRKLGIDRPLKGSITTEQMKRLYLRGGKTLLEIAGLAGLTEGGVGYRLKRAGVRLRTPQDRLSDASKDAPFLDAGLKPLEPFTGNNAPRLCACSKCGRMVAPSRSNLHRGQGSCKYCAARAITVEEADAYFTKAQLEPLEPFRRSGARRLCRCLKCNSKVRVRQNDLQQGQGGCLTCAGTAPKRLPKGKLKHLYVDQNLSVTQVAEVLGCSSTTVLKNLYKHGIPISERYEKYGIYKPGKIELKQWYVADRMSSHEIAAKCSTTRGTVLKWLKSSGLAIPENESRKGVYRDKIFLKNSDLYWTKGVLYLVKFPMPQRRSFLKVGIGMRYGRRLKTHELAGAEVLQLRHGPLYDCFVIEQQILRDFWEYRFYPDEEFLKGGRSECLRSDAPVDLDAYELKPV